MSRDMIVILALTLITILAWIAFDIHHALTKTTLPPIVLEQMQPLDPKINTKVVEDLKTRTK